jgi:hypothetical protein
VTPGGIVHDFKDPRMEEGLTVLVKVNGFDPGMLVRDFVDKPLEKLVVHEAARFRPLHRWTLGGAHHAIEVTGARGFDVEGIGPLVTRAEPVGFIHLADGAGHVGIQMMLHKGLKGSNSGRAAIHK